MRDKTTDPEQKNIPKHINRNNILTRDNKIWWRLQSNRLQGEKFDKAIDRLQKSFTYCEKRKREIPKPTLAGNLPIHEHIESISSVIKDHQVVIVCGDTGSGKTTQLPKICLACGLGARGLIGHTQPRRIAARTVADRIAQEMNAPPGEYVGYKVRFDDRHRQDHYIKLMTDGILLAEIQEDPFLSEYETIIIDEAHERSLNIDFILGHLKSILKKRRDLKIIITSATINPEAFSEFFHHAPIVKIPGKTFPITHYFETEEDDKNNSDQLTDRIRDLVTDIIESPMPGDMLIFLPGERQIRDASKSLHRHLLNRTVLLPLYSRLSPQQQKQVFQSTALPKVILATNVAETSLTVPGIRYVIDSGLARISRYSVRSKIQRLPIEKVSRASIRQRAGRCGRTGPGTCFHLYTEHDHDQRAEYTEPEILRTNLAEVILRMSSAKLGSIDEFPFIDPPERKAINDGYRLLRDLRALNAEDRISKTGHLMASFPLDPRLARILVESKNQNCGREIIIIISALAVGDVRLYPREQLQNATLAHRQFQHEKSDFMGLLAMWDYLHSAEVELSSNQFRRKCEKEFISHLRWREWRELHTNLMRTAKQNNWNINTRSANYDTLHRCLLTGFIDHIGKYDKENKQYSGLRNRSFTPHPQSFLHKSSNTWLMASALVETSSVFAHICAVIEPEWIHNAAKHLIKYRYSEPYWDPRSGFVRSTETASLHGLVLHADKRVNFESIDPQAARKVFIRSALATNQLGLKTDFSRFNAQLLEQLTGFAEKTRQPYLEPDFNAINDQLEAVVPDKVCSRQSFAQWYRNQQPDAELRFSRQAVFGALDTKSIDQQYPDQLQVGDLTLPILYEFNPQRDSDGIHYVIDRAIVSHIQADYTEWTIQPWLLDKVSLILRALPKQERKKIAPIETAIQNFLQQHTSFQCGFYQSLCDYLYQHCGIKYSIKQLLQTPLPGYLRPFYRLIEDGQEVARGENLIALQQTYGIHRQSSSRETYSKKPNQTRYTAWRMGTIANEAKQRKGDHLITVYPALVDDKDAVVVRNFTSAATASEHHLDGIIRLILFQLSDSAKYIKKQIIHKSKLPILYSIVDTNADVSEEFLHFLIRAVFLKKPPIPRDENTFNALIQQHKSELVSAAEKHCAQLIETLESLRRCRSSLNDANPFLGEKSRLDIQSQMQHLLYPGFLYDIEEIHFSTIHHYLQTIRLRIQKAQQRPDAEIERCRQIEPLWAAYCELDQWHSAHQNKSIQTPALHWMLQDYRVHLFTQEMQKGKISLKTIEKQMEQAKREKLLADR